MHVDKPGEYKEADQMVDEGISIEKQQEQLLMSKLASNGKLPAKPQTTFLQRKLRHQRKFFDSGDYALNKINAKNPAILMDDPQNKTCSVAASIFLQNSNSTLRIDVPISEDESLEIPRPDTVPQRKSSIIYPAAHSKLSPLPHLHHSASSYDDTVRSEL
ncbi:unnamed protein product [Dracunculus medinensis]|uniref:mRNA stability protein n=1 Tax=Dracunculus medinensis TaxID=318479 RepID=A0A0N4UI92_DRAME|nr:unnamed protein product [Dracunculus medinensis]